MLNTIEDEVTRGELNGTDVTYRVPSGAPAHHRRGSSGIIAEREEHKTRVLAGPANWGNLLPKTPSDFLFDVKLHGLLSRRVVKAAMLPPDIRRYVETSATDLAVT